MTVQTDPARDLVTAAGRRAVARLAPEELPFYEQVAAHWREHSGPPGSWPPGPPGSWSVPGSSIGFGIDAALVSEVVLQTVSSAFGEIMVLGGTAAGAGLLRWRRRNRTSAAEAPPESTDDPESTGNPESTGDPGFASDQVGRPRWRRRNRTPAAGPPPEFTDDQVGQLRDACVRHALLLDLTAEQADQLADAVVATLTDPDGD